MTLAAYSNSFSGVFVFDDEPAIAQNPNIRTLWPLTTAMRAPVGSTLSGRPIAALSFAIDTALFDGSLAGYHAANLLVHAAAALLLFGIARRTLLTAPLRSRFGEAATPLACAIALLFAVHPLQTGAVTYIVQRVESLAGMFYLATLYSAIRAIDSPATARRRWAATSIVSCALGMGTKEVMVSAPLMVMLWDHHFAHDRAARRWPLYLALCATWIILAILVAGGHRSPAVGFGFAEWPWWRYLMTQAGVLLHYLRLAVVPTPLVLDYDWRPATSIAQVVVPGALLLGFLMATIVGIFRRSAWAFASASFFLILAPTSSVLPIVTEIAAEHRMYLPLAGIIGLAVPGVYALAGRAAVVAAIIVAMVFAGLTYRRNADYHDYDRIWLDTIAKRPRNARARNNYATSLLMKGRHAEAERHLRVAVEEQPSFAEAHANLGVALAGQRRLDEAAGHLRTAVRLRPDYSDAHRNLGEAYALQGRLGDALGHYMKALEYQPDDVGLLNRASWIMATARDASIRDGARARALAERAVQLSRRLDADALDSLAAALAETGAFAPAAATAREAAEVAGRQGNAALAQGATRRMQLYASGRPFYE
jgi:Flp pilus assembly protein TadD